LYKPKPIETPTDAKSPPTVGGPSPWNSAGTTWEDRDLTAWAQERLRERLSQLSVPTFTNGSLKVTAVSKVDGEATIVFTRGKKKMWI